ncbi:MAG: YkgJ family cysteine cluster protein [Flavobacteriaceae bacterium]|jgi:Fe-S-cluster containining protein|nr:YkgJ family cysteine cluster protein [Flavobacteriaceae bacterium]
MSIARKVNSVQRLFFRLEKEIHTFQNTTGLNCIAGCGKCCAKPDIEASPLEFLPWAFSIFKEGRALEVLKALTEEKSSMCHLYRPLSLTEQASGSCGDYQHRGLICRLFGYGANRDKLGQMRLITCTLIKNTFSDRYEATKTAIEKGLYVPVFTDYYQKLAQIDLKLGSKILPVNKAMKVALEEVLYYYAYRPFPKGYKKAA